ncbi:hypothetical protein CKA32_004890 [Geitlerinema sp. FC II]|nr:hypothetical protein CKA32_004890 [Geitlerinema sp. FC II]
MSILLGWFYDDRESLVASEPVSNEDLPSAYLVEKTPLPKSR